MKKSKNQLIFQTETVQNVRTPFQHAVFPRSGYSFLQNNISAAKGQIFFCFGGVQPAVLHIVGGVAHIRLGLGGRHLLDDLCGHDGHHSAGGRVDSSDVVRDGANGEPLADREAVKGGKAHSYGWDTPVRRSADSAVAARCVERRCREVAICHYRCIMECRSSRARDKTRAPTRPEHHPARKVCGERRTSRMNIPETQSLPRSHSARASLTFPPITTWRSPSRRSPTHTTTSIPGMPRAGRPR